MSIKIREQAGTDAGRKFDYQMAVALDYLLTHFKLLCKQDFLENADEINEMLQ